MKRILADGRGAAFNVVPSKGVVPPWGEIVVSINSYNNLVGIYEDWLHCSVGNVQMRLPVRLTVVGTPIKFSGPQLVSRNDNHAKSAPQMDLVNFGARVINTGWGPTDGIRLLQARTIKARTRSVVGEMVTKNTTTPSEESKNLKTMSKQIIVENHSPREVRLEWVVYLKHKNNTKSQHDEEFDLNTYLGKKNRVQSNEVGVIDISPQIMSIQPFKNAVLQCNFRNCCLGTFDAVILADICYLNGKRIQYGPRRISKKGETPHETPIITENMTTISIKDMDAIAKVRIQAKCIEPRLSLDIGTRIRIKKALNQVAAMTSEYGTLSSVNFLVNSSDAVCSFTLTCTPSDLFSVKPSKGQLKNAAEGIYELKQKAQMMITVYYTGSDEFQDINGKRRISYWQSDRSSTVVHHSNEPVTRQTSGLSGILEADCLSEGEYSSRQRQVRSPGSGKGSSDSMQKISGATESGLRLETGTLNIHYTNGMNQEISIILEGAYE